MLGWAAFIIGIFLYLQSPLSYVNCRVQHWLNELTRQQLNDLRELVRGPLSKIERQILSALIVIEVHARDVVNKMIDEDVKNVNDFEWISQLRFVTLFLVKLSLFCIKFNSKNTKYRWQWFIPVITRFNKIAIQS